MILRWEIILDCPDEPNVITGVFVSERGRQESQRRRRDHRSRDQSDVIARSEDEGGARRQGIQAASRSWNIGKKMHFPLEPPEGTQPC